MGIFTGSGREGGLSKKSYIQIIFFNQNKIIVALSKYRGNQYE